MVIRNSQGAEGVLKQYEDHLREVHTVPSDVKEVETYRRKLKVNVCFYLVFICTNLILNSVGFSFHLKPAENASRG